MGGSEGEHFIVSITMERFHRRSRRLTYARGRRALIHSLMSAITFSLPTSASRS